MKISHRSFSSLVATAALGLGLATAASTSAAAVFANTDTPFSWTVDANTSSVDGQGQAGFLTNAFHVASGVNVADLNRFGWIANNAEGTNGNIGNWTYFTFQQSFWIGASEVNDTLSFNWAADDSGAGHDWRGAYAPHYQLNNGNILAGSWSTSSNETYSFGDLTSVSGFHEGWNTLTFYVEGNGKTDGMALANAKFTSAVPETGSLAMLAAGLGLLGMMSRRAKRNA